MCSTGWIKIFYRFKEWEWYDDCKMVKLFIHLLLSANYEERRWKGITVPRGALIASIDSLSKDTRLTPMEIRSRLDKLTSTGEISQKQQGRNRIITICAFDTYQGEESSGQQGFNKNITTLQQGFNKKTTTPKEYKNKEYISSTTINAPAHTYVREEFLEDFFDTRRQAAIEQLCMNLRINRETLRRLADEVLTEWEVTSQPPHSDINDAYKHLLNSIRIKLQQQRREQSSTRPSNETDRKDRLQQRRGTDAPANRPEDYSASF